MTDVKHHEETVASLHVSGAGANAGLLLTQIGGLNFEAKGSDRPQDDAAYGHIFQGFVALLGASIASQKKVKVGYVDDPTGKRFIHFLTLSTFD